MGQTSYSDMYTYGMIELPGVEEHLFTHYLQQASRKFCRLSLAFNDILDCIKLVNYKKDYDLSLFHNNSDASILQIQSVSQNYIDTSPTDYELYESKWLRFADSVIPQNNTSNRLLKCDTCVKTVYTDWTSITDGYFNITVGTSTYEAGPCDFSSALNMDDVANIIATEWRDAQSYTSNNVKWSEKSNCFIFYTESGDISYLTASTSGTDISGALYLNGLSTSNASVSPLLLVRCAFLPDVKATSIPTWFFDRYAESIVAGAIYMLSSLRGPISSPNKWYNPDYAKVKQQEFERGISEAKSTFRKSGTNKLLQIL